MLAPNFCIFVMQLQTLHASHKVAAGPAVGKLIEKSETRHAEAIKRQQNISECWR